MFAREWETCGRDGILRRRKMDRLNCCEDRIYIYIYIKIRGKKKKLRKGGKRLLQGRDRIQAGPRVQSVKLFHIQDRFTFALEFAIARFHGDVKARPEAERVPDESGGDLYRMQRYKCEEDTDSESFLTRTTSAAMQTGNIHLI